MLDRISMDELKDYILSRYPNRRGEDRELKYDLVDMGERELKSYGRFAYKDCLSITIGYSDAWKTADRFQAVLLNGLL